MQKHRSILDDHLVEQVGEETAGAMLAQFPSRDLDEPVTKEFVEFVELKIVELRGDLKEQIHLQTDRVISRLQTEGAIAVIVLAVVNALIG